MLLYRFRGKVRLHFGQNKWIDEKLEKCHTSDPSHYVDHWFEVHTLAIGYVVNLTLHTYIIWIRGRCRVSGASRLQVWPNRLGHCRRTNIPSDTM